AVAVGLLAAPGALPGRGRPAPGVPRGLDRGAWGVPVGLGAAANARAPDWRAAQGARCSARCWLGRLRARWEPAEPRLSRTPAQPRRSEEHTSELQSRENLVCRLL